MQSLRGVVFALVLPSILGAFAARAEDENAQTPGAVYTVRPPPPTTQTVPDKNATAAPLLRLDAGDWADANVHKWGGNADLAGDGESSSDVRAGLSPEEFAQQGLQFSQSSLVNTGPGLRHGVPVGKQFSGVAKSAGMELGNLAIGGLIDQADDALSDK